MKGEESRALLVHATLVTNSKLILPLLHDIRINAPRFDVIVITKSLPTISSSNRLHVLFLDLWRKEIINERIVGSHGVLHSLSPASRRRISSVVTIVANSSFRFAKEFR